MGYRHIEELDPRGKRILVRVDYNVPLDKNSRISDLNRIRKTLPTLRYLLKHKAKKIILLTHWGRPDGKRIPRMSCRHLKPILEKLLRRKIGFLADFGIKKKTPRESIILFENLRFWKEEEANNTRFAENLAALGDVFVNDAFSVCHRAHASIVGIPRYLPSYGGILLDTEVDTICSALENPHRPLLAIVGGAKVETKIVLLNNLLKSVDRLLIGGRMPFTFAAAARGEKAKTAVDENSIRCAGELLKNRSFLKKAVLAKDFIAGDKDIGEHSIARFCAEIKKAKTVVWNGTMGVVEDRRYRQGTRALARVLAERSADGNATSIVGGGDTAAFVEELRLSKKFTHVSTGGGAALVLFEGGELVGVRALEENKQRFGKK